MISRRVLKPIGVLCTAGFVALMAAASPAHASHVGCGSVIMTNTTLDTDVGPCAGDGLIVAASNITLDLSGHTVAGTGTGTGVRVGQQFGVVVKNGAVVGFHEGLVLDEADGNTITLLALSGNVRQGITLAGSNNNLIDRNTIFDNGGDAIRLGLSSDNEVRRNTTTGNVFGIGVADGSTNNLIARNTVSDSDVFGIAVFSSANNNRVVSNTVVGTASGDGISVSADSSGARLRRNTANANGDDGIDVDNPSTRVTENVANDNADLGIEAVAGTRDGGGNTASGNGNPAQCVGVSCS